MRVMQGKLARTQLGRVDNLFKLLGGKGRTNLSSHLIQAWKRSAGNIVRMLQIIVSMFQTIMSFPIPITIEGHFEVEGNGVDQLEEKILN